ncbi:hypothetical protein BGX27_006012 [Mortierella sp. AM989]|nr:hypothetical protein BGX27_006012 [Mortierella sp. AM989]
MLNRCMYFEANCISTSRTRTAIAKGKEKSECDFRVEDALEIKGDAAFNITADFNACLAGHYSIRWRIKALEKLSNSNGLHFTANVLYTAESDANRVLDVCVHSNLLKSLEENQRYDLELEETFMVHPHLEVANVRVALCSVEKSGDNKNSGLIIERVEIRPISQVMNSEEGVKRVKFERDSDVICVNRLAEVEGNAQITRLVASKSGSILASLSLSDDKAFINVWNMAISDMRKGHAVTDFEYPGISDIPVGLAISPNGDQIAVYQEPKIGQWKERSNIEEAEFQFKLFDNTLVYCPEAVSNTQDDWAPVIIPLRDFTPSLNPVDSVPGDLESFIGYGEFLNDSKPSTDTNGHKSLFVACNGLYLDVFEITKDKKWKWMHSISLADLTPTISRRITCKMMMKSIKYNTFMWLEDDGICCTVWDLLKGTNVSYISDNERNHMGRETRYSKMAMSPSETIVILATTNGTLTTFVASTGAPIDSRVFPGFKIEHVGFHNNDTQPFVVLRDSESLKLSARILDSYQLRSEISLNQIPIPKIDSTILAFFDTREFRHKGVICEAFGSKINFYTTHHPISPRVEKKSTNEANSSKSMSLPQDGHLSYRLEVGHRREHLPEGLHARYWVHHVKVIEESVITKKYRVIFSFVPEPWMRMLTTKAADPSRLMSAYFLPDEKRFVVIGMQTIQIWKLPTPFDQHCSLQFIWSHPKDEESIMAIPHNKLRSVGEYYKDICNAAIYMDATNTGNTVAEIEMADNQSISVSVPGPEYSEAGARANPGAIGLRFAVEQCFKSIHLLAAAYAFCMIDKEETIGSESRPMISYEDHAKAIIQFTVVHLSRQIPTTKAFPLLLPNTQDESTLGAQERRSTGSTSGSQQPNPEIKQTTLLKSLLDPKQLQMSNHVFVKGLLAAEGGFWVPTDDEELNPIRHAIDIGQRPLIEAFMDYGVKYAKLCHPSYLLPVVRCMRELSEKYPDLVESMFKKSSYVPAHNHGYINSHMIVAGPQYWMRLKSLLMFCFPNRGLKKSNNLDDYYKPVFSLRSQLPIRATTFISRIQTFFSGNRISKFPVTVDEETKRSRSKFTHKVYVCPFPMLSEYQAKKRWNSRMKSAFTTIAGKDYFGNPAMNATLRFKWQKYGQFYWLLRFSLVFLFAVLMATITIAQVTVSTRHDPTLLQADSSKEIAARYLPHMHGVFHAAIANGCLLIVYEIVQSAFDKKRYLWSPYNYMDLITYIICVTGCIMFLNEKPTVDGVDSGPHQIEALSLAILALYLNLIFELRIFKQLGIVVNIIFNIAKKIIWFLMILGFFMISFTLALQHLLHTRQYRPACIPKDSNTTDTTNTTNTTCDLEDYPAGYPTNVFAALTDTYFFLAGRYEPVGNSLDKGSTSFRIMMLIFFIFTAILLLNILIALMNDAYDHSKSQGEVAWLKLLSGVISEVEQFWMIKRDREESDYFPDYIYYYAPEQDAEIYESKEQITDKSNLSPENKFLMDTMTERYDRLSAAHHAVNKKLEEEIQDQKNSLGLILQDICQAVGIKEDQSSKNAASPIDSENINDADGAPLDVVNNWAPLRMRMETIRALNNLIGQPLPVRSRTIEYTMEGAQTDNGGQDTAQ